MTVSQLGTVLVTGGAGFIGRALAERLASHAERWVVVDSLNPRTHGPRATPNLGEEVEFVAGDVSAKDTWDPLLEGVKPDVVIHLAAETDTSLSLDHAARFARVNVTGTAQMLDAFGRSGATPDRVLVASSRAVYGEGSWESEDGRRFSPGQRTHRQLSEQGWDFEGARPLPSRASDTLPRPTSIYGATKHAQETLLSSWCGARDVGLSILRLQNVYGSGQSLLNPYTGILPFFARTASSGAAIELYEDGLMSRDFVHVDDVVEAFVGALRLPTETVGVYDIGSGVRTTVLDVATVVGRTFNAPPPAVTGRFRDGDVRHAWSDTSETAEALRWSPRIDWESGIQQYANWFVGVATNTR